MPQEHKATTVNKPYKGPLFREVPRNKTPMSSSDYNFQNCWHCQENPRIQTDFGMLVWCERCYKLQAKRSDGTFVQQSTIPILKDLVDIQQGKVKIIPEIPTERKIIQE